MSDKLAVEDYAVACTQHLFDQVYVLLRPEEREEVWQGIYARVKATLELFALETLQNRLVPGNN